MNVSRPLSHPIHLQPLPSEQGGQGTGSPSRFSENIVSVASVERPGGESSVTGSGTSGDVRPFWGLQADGSVRSEDLLDGFFCDCKQRLSENGAAGQAVVSSIENTSSGCREFVEELAIVDMTLAAMKREVNSLKESGKIDASQADALHDKISSLDKKKDAVRESGQKLMSKKLKATTEEKNHSSRITYHQNGRKLRVHYIKATNQMVEGFTELAGALRSQRGDSLAPGISAGEYLFALLVEHVTVPGIAERKGCTVEEAWAKYVDISLRGQYGQTCGSIGSNTHCLATDEMRHMTRHLEQALDLYKEAGGTSNRCDAGEINNPPTPEGGPPDTGPGSGPGGQPTAAGPGPGPGQPAHRLAGFAQPTNKVDPGPYIGTWLKGKEDRPGEKKMFSTIVGLRWSASAMNMQPHRAAPPSSSSSDASSGNAVEHDLASDMSAGVKKRPNSWPVQPLHRLAGGVAVDPRRNTRDPGSSNGTWLKYAGDERN